MSRFGPKLTVLFIAILIVQSVLPVLAQAAKELDAGKWANALDKKGNAGNEELGKLDSLLCLHRAEAQVSAETSGFPKLDSSEVFKFLDELEKKGASKGHYFRARFNFLKARQIYFRTIYLKNARTFSPETKEAVKKLLSAAIEEAYRSEDNFLVAFVSYFYAGVISQFGELGLAVMYAMNGIDMWEKLAYNIGPGSYQFLAEKLYKVREYKDCIKYGKKAIDAWRNSPNEIKSFTISCINTVALGYHRQHLYDSALIFYNEALQLAEKENIPVWAGIVSGNIGQIYYEQNRYDTAYALLKKDYQLSSKSRFYDNAANSLQWAARANLARGNKTTALTEVREAFRLLKLWPDANYLKNAYYTTTQIFRQMNDYDSAFYYNSLYSTLNDSLERIVNTSSMDISRARLNDEISRYNIQKLNEEKRSELMYRNVIIIGVVLLSVIGLLYLNRSRIQLRYKQQMANAEVLAAKEKLQLFTENIIEKTSLIDKLEKQVSEKVRTDEQQEIVAALSTHTILTEADWEKFKTLYETIYPGFFSKLKTTIPDISIAEQRMAALIRLHLTTRQMASLLGISPNSVNKTRQRLRQRFNLPADLNVEEFVMKL